MRKRPPSKRIDLVQKLGILMFSLLLSALAVEGAWRSFLGRRAAPATVYDEVLGWGFAANVKGRHTSGDFDVEVRTDGLGRRRAGDDQVDSGRPKVVFAGDSITFGWGVEVEDSFPFLIGNRLEVEVVNLGVSGYGTDQQYLKLRRDGLPLGPAAVVVTLSENDFVEVMSDWGYGWTKPRFRWQDQNLVLSPAGERSPFLERYSSLYRSLKFYRRLRFPSGGFEAAQLPDARRLVRRLIRSMAEESRQAGARFFVVHSGDEWLAQALDEDGVGRIDVATALRDAVGREGPVSFAGDPHWNARGHRVIAESLAPKLETVLDTGPGG